MLERLAGEVHSTHCVRSNKYRDHTAHTVTNALVEEQYIRVSMTEYSMYVNKATVHMRKWLMATKVCPSTYISSE